MARGWLTSHKKHGLFFVSRVVFDPTRPWEGSHKQGTSRKVGYGICMDMYVSSLEGILWSTDYWWLLGNLRSKWLMTLRYLLNGGTFPTFLGGDGMGKCL